MDALFELAPDIKADIESALVKLNILFYNQYSTTFKRESYFTTEGKRYRISIPWRMRNMCY